MARAKFQVSSKADRTVDGIIFDSKNEMLRYLELKLLYQAGQIESLVLQPEFPVKINDQNYCTYTADFAYYDLVENKQVIEDVKVAITEKDAAYRLRKKAAELYHSVEIRAVDHKGNKLGGRKKRAALPRIKKRGR